MAYAYLLHCFPLDPRSVHQLATMRMVQVLLHVAERLSDIHGACYVHRDVKPSNVVWLRHERRWTLIDFGCAARTGEAAPMAFTLKYAAPEVVRAFRNGDRTITADTATDAWSLGILGIELIAHKEVQEEVLQDYNEVCISEMQCHAYSVRPDRTTSAPGPVSHSWL